MINQNSTLIVDLTLGDFTSIDHRFFSVSPNLSAIRKDNYQAWRYADDALYDGPEEIAQQLCAKINDPVNRCTGIVCETAPVIGTSEYFWPEVIDKQNAHFIKETGQARFNESSVCPTAVDILVPANFVVIRFHEILRKQTIKYKGTTLCTLQYAASKKPFYDLPTLLLTFINDKCEFIEICDVHNSLHTNGFSIATTVPVTYNTSSASVR